MKPLFNAILALLALFLTAIPLVQALHVADFCPALNNTIHTTTPGIQFSIECGVDRYQGDIPHGDNAVGTFGQCISLCTQTPACVGVAYKYESASCHLKDHVNEPTTDAQVWSAVVVERPVEVETVEVSSSSSFSTTTLPPEPVTSSGLMARPAIISESKPGSGRISQTSPLSVPSPTSTALPASTESTASTAPASSPNSASTSSVTDFYASPTPTTYGTKSEAPGTGTPVPPTRTVTPFSTASSNGNVVPPVDSLGVTSATDNVVLTVPALTSATPTSTTSTSATSTEMDSSMGPSQLSSVPSLSSTKAWKSHKPWVTTHPIKNNSSSSSSSNSNISSSATPVTPTTVFLTGTITDSNASLAVTTATITGEWPSLTAVTGTSSSTPSLNSTATVICTSSSSSSPSIPLWNHSPSEILYTTSSSPTTTLLASNSTVLSSTSLPVNGTAVTLSTSLSTNTVSTSNFRSFLASPMPPNPHGLPIPWWKHRPSEQLNTTSSIPNATLPVFNGTALFSSPLPVNGTVITTPIPLSTNIGTTTSANSVSSVYSSASPAATISSSSTPTSGSHPASSPASKSGPTPGSYKSFGPTSKATLTSNQTLIITVVYPVVKTEAEILFSTSYQTVPLTNDYYGNTMDTHTFVRPTVTITKQIISLVTATVPATVHLLTDSSQYVASASSNLSLESTMGSQSTTTSPHHTTSACKGCTPLHGFRPTKSIPTLSSSVSTGNSTLSDQNSYHSHHTHVAQVPSNRPFPTFSTKTEGRVLPSGSPSSVASTGYSTKLSSSSSSNSVVQSSLSSTASGTGYSTSLLGYENTRLATSSLSSSSSSSPRSEVSKPTPFGCRTKPCPTYDVTPTAKWTPNPRPTTTEHVVPNFTKPWKPATSTYVAPVLDHTCDDMCQTPVQSSFTSDTTGYAASTSTLEWTQTTVYSSSSTVRSILTSAQPYEASESPAPTTAPSVSSAPSLTYTKEQPVTELTPGVPGPSYPQNHTSTETSATEYWTTLKSPTSASESLLTSTRPISASNSKIVSSSDKYKTSGITNATTTSTSTFIKTTSTFTNSTSTRTGNKPTYKYMPRPTKANTPKGTKSSADTIETSTLYPIVAISIAILFLL
ncbi:hypothetical protein B0J11DRAFT_571697 [Dendryphion nanum]|uniref:Apple domain-containing protein n=1 Tax=Dendryphion nanum TaxID=256645 RepID=A0A9P9DAR4_9PLEO|nr:hypothetical protein B0J11DRAFT_571697 [Dendryphion nanum]